MLNTWTMQLCQTRRDYNYLFFSFFWFAKALNENQSKKNHLKWKKWKNRQQNRSAKEMKENSNGLCHSCSECIKNISRYASVVNCTIFFLHFTSFRTMKSMNEFWCAVFLQLLRFFFRLSLCLCGKTMKNHVYFAFEKQWKSSEAWVRAQ